jgi:hypothetical protein
MSDLGPDPDLKVSIDRLLNNTRAWPSERRKSALQAVIRVIDSIGDVTTQIFLPEPPEDDTSGVIPIKAGGLFFTNRNTTTMLCPHCSRVLKVTLESS